jgi:hypothetical protein
METRGSQGVLRSDNQTLQAQLLLILLKCVHIVLNGTEHELGYGKSSLNYMQT